MQAHRDLYRRYLDNQADPTPAVRAAGARAFLAPDAAVNVVHPFNALDGAEGFVGEVLDPLARAFSQLTRNDYVAIAGEFEGGDWVSSTGYWCGQWDAPFCGLRPTGELAFLRVGEFHRIEDGRAVESYVFLDLPELMVASDRWPIAHGPAETRGHTGLIPGPMTQDGLRWTAGGADRGAESYRMVTDMLRALNTPDEAWRPYWHDHMIWYGPGAFGSFVGIEGFRRFQVPFERAFDGWSGGAAGNGITSHFARYGDGDYVCSGGWPSLTGVQVGPFLGVAPTGERVLMRVCDWWRREGDKLRENWVFVDVPHALLQLGRDVLAEAGDG